MLVAICIGRRLIALLELEVSVPAQQQMQTQEAGATFSGSKLDFSR